MVQTGMMSLSSLTTALLSAILLFPILAIADNYSVPISTYRSRPDLEVPAINISISKPDKISPGYIFIAPYQADQTGPYIYDNEGNLVWSGWSMTVAATAHDFHVCDYKGESGYLCVFQGNQQLGYARGAGIILDNTYKPVAHISSGQGKPPNDQHEFNLKNNGSVALVTVYQPVVYDLSPVGIQGQGWVSQAVFQAINVTTGDVIFNWNSLDHVALNNSYTAPNTTDTSGDGLTAATAWDYFHINAIDLDQNGNYLVSGRHVCTLYCINSTDGSIIWQMNGLNDSSSSFSLENFSFSYQHDIRFISHDDDANTTTISIYDNASNGYNATSTYSAGKIIQINHGNGTATMLQEYAAPSTSATPDKLLSTSQGNLQLLENGNRFLGFGSMAWYLETDESGDAVLFATFASTDVMHYRAYKFNFTGAPTGEPSVYGYALNSSAPTSLWVSWNGCTECAYWNFYTATADTVKSDPSTYTMTTTNKTGFETMFTSENFTSYAFVEALDANNNSLSNSSVISVFVPGSDLVSICNDFQCPVVIGYANEGNYTQTINSTSQGTATTIKTPSIYISSLLTLVLTAGWFALL